MYAVNLLEEAGGGTGSLWIPVLVLGWFLTMTIVGWQVSRRNLEIGDRPEDTRTAHSEDNPSEFDHD